MHNVSISFEILSHTLRDKHNDLVMPSMKSYFKFNFLFLEVVKQMILGVIDPQVPIHKQLDVGLWNFVFRNKFFDYLLNFVVGWNMF